MLARPERPREHWVNLLRFSIVEQAVYDYEDALIGARKYACAEGLDEIMSRKRKNPLTIKQADALRQQTLNLHNRTIAECEMFFRSDWCKMLCDYDGERIIKAIRKRAEKCSTV